MNKIKKISFNKKNRLLIMAKIHFKGTKINTNGNLPVVGSVAPNFTLVKGDLSDGSLSDF